MNAQAALEPMQAFAELGRIHLRDNNMSQVLGRISDLAKRTISAAEEVSVTLMHADQASTAAFTGDLALHLDESQYETGGGPCLAAAAGGETMHVSDMATEDRWPDYTPEALRLGARSSISVGIPVQQTVTGALNVYSTRADAFDDEAVQLAGAFASYAAVALANAHLYASTAALAGQMKDAMATRAVIEQAKGILVSQRGCTPDQAFDILVRASKNANRKLREIAEAMVEKSQHA
ncbi:MAG: GAF and ANTAR domain-containing protein [Actinomycetota bacterium]|nr:GAF and ANTAR domain-containing protein [Actinomycetota bacterium]